MTAEKIERERHPAAAGAHKARDAKQRDRLTALLTMRRQRRVREWWGREDELRADGAGLRDCVGIAFSGGGIRSATFSLGVIQALARSSRLAAIDVMSTVSGGGYIGCFLRSLFLPRDYRGIERSVSRTGAFKAPKLDAVEQHFFAMRALRAAPDQRTIAAPGTNDQVCSPVWWLRQHSRYLAPSASDYSYAVAYLIRNWLTMLYVFALGVAIVAAVAGGVEGRVETALGGDVWTCARSEFSHLRAVPGLKASEKSEAAGAAACAAPLGATAREGASPKEVVATVRVGGSGGAISATTKFGDQAGTDVWAYVSPVALLALLPLLGACVLGMAYWATNQMSSNEASELRQVWCFVRLWVLTALAGLFALGIATIVGGGDPLAGGHVQERATPASITVLVFLAVGAASLFVSCLVALCVAATSRKLVLLTAELRRTLTSLLATALMLTAVVVAVAVVEGLAAVLRDAFWNGSAARQLVGGAVVPVFAYLLHKLPGWTKGGDTGSKSRAILARALPTVALAIGIALYGMVAVLVTALVQAATWSRAAWTSSPDWESWQLMMGLLAPLLFLTGRADGFLNLSSLHNLYASRLTRAFLGASNVERLRSIASSSIADVVVTDNHDADYIQPDIYQRIVIPAPMHILNATLNTTIDPKSQLVARDRKGDLLSVGPHGVVIGGSDPSDIPWSKLGRRLDAQSLSLGQWCAISGAAASTGMGRLTNLGYAVALTFANVRLGYWWWAPGLVPDAGTMSFWKRVKSRAVGGFAAVFPTFVYLANEMTARYSRRYVRQYLSDGGHFENTGAYALVRRGVPLVLVCDNGADPGYGFEDLETLVRLVRIDLGKEVKVLGGAALAEFRREMGCEASDVFADPAAGGGWKHKIADQSVAQFAVVLAVDECDGSGSATRIVWIKPKLQPGLPEDVVGYARGCPSFPQQTTGDQFYDEAQWESYRKLGQFTMERLTASCPGLLRDILVSEPLEQYSPRSLLESFADLIRRG